MQLPSIPSFIPMGPIRRKRSERVAELRAEDAKIQAARNARLARGTRRPAHKPHIVSADTPKSAPAVPIVTRTPVQQRPITHRRLQATPKATAATPQKPVTQQPTPIAPITVPVQPTAATPAPTVSTYVTKNSRGTYANDFSRRSSYVAQPSRA